jgi:hypothetical protein
MRLTGGAGARRGSVAAAGVRKRERRVGQRGDGALTGGPRPHSAGARFKPGLKLVQKCSNDSNGFKNPTNFG